MIRRINHTGRARIPRQNVQISTSDAGSKLVFDAKIDLTDHRLPEDSLIFVEAYRQAAWMRFPFGTVGKPSPGSTESRELTQFESLDGVKFRLKITNSEGRRMLLAEADSISISSVNGKAAPDSLIAVVPENLGQQLWRIDLDTDTEPQLLVNELLPDWRQMVESPWFSALVLPQVLRSVLREILIEHGCNSLESEDWRSRWLQFACSMLDSEGAPSSTDDEEACHQFIESAVAKFSDRFAFKDQMVAALEVK